MSNDYFEFKHFTIHQDRCAMKVGMDGVTLGAWIGAISKDCIIAASPKRILDIGTGTGLIALMMAQLHPQSDITAIEIDPTATAQAKENIDNTIYADRIDVVNISLQDYAMRSAHKFDIIVTNPPFFDGSLKNPNERKSTARHTVSLTYKELIKCSCKLLSEEGLIFIIVPAEGIAKIEEEAIYVGLHEHRLCALHTVEGKPVKRYLISLSKTYLGNIIKSDLSISSNEYKKMTKDFYIK